MGLSPELVRKCKHYRISEVEYHRICELLGHAPEGIEWALFSALWSEHCSYKSSKVHLRKFSYRNSSVLESEGENAGIIDLGENEKIVFKMESHNHPSFIEPYQGAATGVGGILRDIFTMGARPIALADYLCFGTPDAPRMQSLVKGVVHGISGYGNCVGVPTVSGQTEFDSSYNNNILVNAMAVGLLRKGDVIALSKAQGLGNYVVYVGAKTGKDGVHGASMASESFDDKLESKKPNVQIGDPFLEKLLIESCLEILRENLVVAMQDMGAAGLTSSSFEMSSKGGVGLTIDLNKVPLRDFTMTPEEILLSESQERMLLICEPRNFSRIEEIFRKWDLDATVIGKVEKDRLVKLYWNGELICSIDPDLLVENAPRYERPYKPWKAHSQRGSSFTMPLQGPVGPVWDLVFKFLRGPVGMSREWVYRQYDQRVGLRTVQGADHGVSLLRLPDTGRGLSLATGCRPQLMRMDAQIGAYDSVFYPSLQMIIKGAWPKAVTDCLNFGNPEKENIMSEFVASVEAIAHASQLLDAPVISGNVSFYNETLGKNITSTPATGLVGLRSSGIDSVPEDYFTQEGSDVYLLQLPMIKHFCSWTGELGVNEGFTGTFKPEIVATWFREIYEIVTKYNLVSTKAVGKGGLAYTLSRMCLAGRGLKLDPRFCEKMSPEEWLMETLYSVILVVRKEEIASFEKSLRTMCERFAMGAFYHVGEVGGENLEISEGVELKVSEIQLAYQTSWEQVWKKSEKC